MYIIGLKVIDEVTKVITYSFADIFNNQGLNNEEYLNHIYTKNNMILDELSFSPVFGNYVELIEKILNEYVKDFPSHLEFEIFKYKISDPHPFNVVLCNYKDSRNLGNTIEFSEIKQRDNKINSVIS